MLDNNRPLLDKLGVKPGQLILVLGLDDGGFLSQLAERGAAVVRDGREERLDQIFLLADEVDVLGELGRLRAQLVSDGALWVLWAKGRGRQGRPAEQAVREAGLAAGLVDVKIVSFSPTYSALRFVIPRAARAQAR